MFCSDQPYITVIGSAGISLTSVTTEKIEIHVYYYACMLLCRYVTYLLCMFIVY